MATRFVQDRMIYTEVVAKLVPQTQKHLWIATADIKDMYVEHNGSMVPFLKILAELIGKGVEIRLIHAKEPGQPFREDFDRYPRLHRNLERVLCPRVHFKCIIIDGKQADSFCQELFSSFFKSFRPDPPLCCDFYSLSHSLSLVKNFFHFFSVIVYVLFCFAVLLTASI